MPNLPENLRWRPDGSTFTSKCAECGEIRDNHRAMNGQCPNPDYVINVTKDDIFLASAFKLKKTTIIKKAPVDDKKTILSKIL